MTAASERPAVRGPTRRRLLIALGQALLAPLPAACVSVDSLHPGRGGQSFVVRGKTYDQVWNAALKAMSTDMTIVEQHKPSGSIKSRAGAAPGGRVVGFFITPTTPAPLYTVTVVSKTWSPRPDMEARDWEPSVVEDFKAALAP